MCSLDCCSDKIIFYFGGTLHSTKNNHENYCQSAVVLGTCWIYNTLLGHLSQFPVHLLHNENFINLTQKNHEKDPRLMSVRDLQLMCKKSPLQAQLPKIRQNYSVTWLIFCYLQLMGFRKAVSFVYLTE